jgi:hypothetical protein
MPYFPEPVVLNLGVTAVGTSGQPLVATLPLVAGKYHYIGYVEVTLYAVAALTGGATPITVTTSNLPGSPALTFPSALAIGTVVQREIVGTGLIQSSAAGANTTIVCPAVTNGIWRVNAFYLACP